jgi:phospholipid/cholesterol/gamma-HCH transport system substrate-binding protein
MSAYQKNLAVGVTVLTALILLGWMILRFSDAPFRLFAKEQMPIRFRSASAEGLSEGSPVYYLGVLVGRVKSVGRSPDPSDLGVNIEALIEPQPPLPSNVEGRIRSPIFGGGATIHLVLVPENDASDTEARPATSPVAPVATLSESLRPSRRPLQPNQVIDASFVGIADIFPELTHLSEELQKTSRQLREAEVIPKLAGAIDSFRRAADEASEILGSAKSLVRDPKVHDNIREIIANFKETSASARKVAVDFERLVKNADNLVTNTNRRVDQLGDSGHKLLTTANTSLEETSKALMARLAQAAAVLENLERMTKKVNDGQGSMGALVNDPRFYENLLDVSQELKVTINAFSRLVEQWEKEGLYFRLNK